MSPRTWNFRLEDIDSSLEMISQYIHGMDYGSWRKDRKTIDAVIRNIEIIGEAVSHLPDEFTDLHVDIPWHQMKGMRNVLIHEYFGVDTDVLWKTVQKDLPELRIKIQKLLSQA